MLMHPTALLTTHSQQFIVAAAPPLIVRRLVLHRCFTFAPPSLISELAASRSPSPSWWSFSLLLISAAASRYCFSPLVSAAAAARRCCRRRYSLLLVVVRWFFFSPVLQNSKNYGDLNCIGGIREAVLAKQVQSLDNIFASMRRTLEEFHCIVLSLEKMHRDGRQLVKGGSSHSAVKHLQQRVGVKPTLADCLDGLLFLHEIHHSDSSDLGAVQQLLVDQPNIPSEEVQFVFDIIFAEELCS